MSLESEVQANTQIMKEMLTQMRGGYQTGANTTVPGSGSGVLGATNSQFKESILGMAGEFENFTGKLVRNQATIPDLGKVVTSAINPMFGTFGRLFGDAGMGVINFVDESIKNWQDFSKLGPTMYGNFTNLNKAVSQAQLNYDEFADVLGKMNGSQLAYGKTMTEGTQMFANQIDVFSKTDYQRQFNMMGIKEKERAEIAAQAIANWTGLNLSGAEGQALANKAILEFGKNLTAAAEMTGITREQNRKSSEQVDTDLRLFASRVQHIRDGDLAFAGYAQQAKNVMGPAELKDAIIQGLANEGRIYGPTNDALNLLAPQTLEKIRELTAIASDSTRDAKDRDTAMKELLNVQKDFTAETLSNSTMLFTKQDQLSADQKKILEQNKPFMENVLSDLAKNPSGTIGEAIDRLKAAKDLTGQGTNISAPSVNGKSPGEIDTGRETTQFYLSIKNRLKDVGNMTVTVIDGLNKELGQTGKLIQGLNNNPYLTSGAKFTEFMQDWMSTNMAGKGPEAQVEVYAQGLQKFFSGLTPPTKTKEVEKKGLGGTSVPGIPYISSELGFEFDEDVEAKRIYNNGETKTMVQSMTDGMRMFPILSGQLQKTVPDIAQVVSSAVNNMQTSSDDGQNPLLEEVKKLNTIMQSVAGFNKATVDGITKTARAIESTNSVYG
jgi:hypothetical protein